MAETAEQVTTPAEGSTAQEQPSQEQPSNDHLPYMVDEERHTWREKGVLPKRVINPTTEPDGGKDNVLQNLSKKELDKWRDSGELPEPKTEAKESSAEAKRLSDEPKPDDRVWEAQLGEKEQTEYFQRLDGRVKNAIDHIQSHPQRAEIESGLQTLFTDEAAELRRAHFLMALGEIPNPGEVIAHLALNPNGREVLTQAPNWQTARWAVHRLSRVLGSRPNPVSRVPKPPSEVGGRMASTEDPGVAAAKDGDFRSAKAEWNRKAREGRLR